MITMKYKLTEKTCEYSGITLYQIKAVRDIPEYGISEGDLGGWIADESNLCQEDDAWVSGNAKVYGNAKVFGNAWISGDAKVYGDAEVSGNTKVYGNAEVYGNAWVFGNAWV